MSTPNQVWNNYLKSFFEEEYKWFFEKVLS